MGLCNVLDADLGAALMKKAKAVLFFLTMTLSNIHMVAESLVIDHMTWVLCVLGRHILLANKLR